MSAPVIEKPTSAAVHDTESRERQATGDAAEAQHQSVVENLDRKRAMSNVLANPDLTPQYAATDIDNPLAWLGETLRADAFKQRLRKIFPSVFFMTGRDGAFVSILALQPDQSLLPTGVCFQNQPMLPEFSIMNRVVEDIPDPSYDGGCTRADLPKHEFDVERQCWNVDTSQPRPGYVRIERADTERYRGWRVVLLRLWQEGFVSLADVVQEFGAADRLGWAAHTGALDVRSPY